jgi:rhamnosyltransferase
MLTVPVHTMALTTSPVRPNGEIEVAVLLPTYNGARFIRPQIRSLTENKTPFRLHWLDDHSTDDTRELVRTCARNFGINLIEWHQPQRQGCPGTFFQLLECVEADIYLFCDQDDIWQPGKIDATVANLFPDIATATLCYSQALLFISDNPQILRPTYETLFGVKIDTSLRKTQIFMFNPAQGNTVGFTRPLRETFLAHKNIARMYATTHDSWMYMIAGAAGEARALPNAPTTLYRLHASNASEDVMGLRGIRHIPRRWRFQHLIRRWISRQAKGFCLAAATLPGRSKLESLLEIAHLVSTLDRRQPPSVLARLVRLGAMPPNKAWATWIVVACLWCDATDRYDFKAR